MLKPAKTLIVIMGPTAIGKTELAIQLAQYFKTHIISADSRQFYKEMSIGTAKPSKQELLAAKHHFISSHSIQQKFTVGDFETEALKLISKLFKSKDVVILAGGSGLYIQAVCEGFDNLPKAEECVRENLNNILVSQGIEVLQERLKIVDPDYYAEVDIHNPQRVIRALEVWETTGKPFSSYRIKKQNNRPFQIIKLGLNLNRNKLYDRINQRVDLMMQSGLLDEAKKLLPYRHLNALNTVGYAEIFQYLEGQTTLEESVESIKQNTRRFAKRQLTWFRRQKDVKWFEPNQVREITDYLNQQIHLNPGP